MNKLNYLLLVIIIILIFINVDLALSKVENVVGNLEYVTSSFNESAIQEIHTAKITLNTLGYHEVINLNVLSNYESEHELNTNVTVRIKNGYFTDWRYTMFSN